MLMHEQPAQQDRHQSDAADHRKTLVPAARRNVDPAKIVDVEHDAVLRGDAATFTVFLKIAVPRWTLIHAPPPAMRNLNVVPVARLDVRVVVALAEEDADVETWQANETLHYGARAQSFVPPTEVHVRRVSGRAHAPRSRVLAPVLRAWERWWDRVQ